MTAFSFMRTLPLAAVVASVVLLQVSDAFIQVSGVLAFSLHEAGKLSSFL